ncbi:MAG: Yip1 family protein [Candidatus Micrarchaeota archaeon]
MDFGYMGRTWINAITKPMETLKKEVKNDKGMADGFVAYLIAAFVVALAWFARGIISTLGTDILFPALLAGAIFVLAIVGGFISLGLIHIVAKIFGGKANFGKFYYVTSTFSAPIAILCTLLDLVPCIGWLLALILGVYGICLAVITLEKLYGFGAIKAIAVFLLPGIVLAVILVVIMVVLIGTMTSVALLGFMPGLSGDAIIAQSDSYWRGTARPFAILEHSQDGGSRELTMVIQNVDADQREITAINVADASGSGISGDASTYLSTGANRFFSSGDKKMVPVELSGTCTSGTVYEYNVDFAYNTGSINGLTQYGEKTLIGKCY